jgi:mercuric ion transport protein
MRLPTMSGRPDTRPIAATPNCGCTKPKSRDQAKVNWATAGAVFASLGICAACCLLPAVLISLGVAGSFVSSLDALSPYKWIFIAVTATLLGYGFYTVYWKPKRTCAAGTACAVCGSGRPIRVALWLGTVLAVSGIVYGFLEPWLTHR